MIRHLALLLLGYSLLPQALQADPTPVTAARLAEKSFFMEYSAPATTLSLNRSQISAETQGRLQEIPVLVGDPVTRGSPLAQLDCRDNQLQLRRAEAALGAIEARVVLARQRIERSQSLRKQRNVAQEQIDQQRADLTASLADRQAQQAAIEAARLNVERCQLLAPFDGIVAARLVGEGSWLSPAQPVIELIDSQRLEVSTQVAVDQAGSLAQADQIELLVGAERYPLQLRQLVASIDSRGRNREARLQFTGPMALPGATGRVAWRSQQRYVAADLLVRRDGQLGLFLLLGDQARFHPLPDAREGQPARVDLPDDTRLVIEGRQALQNSDPVKVAP